MNSITKKVNDELIKLGASIVGFGDITELPEKCRNSLPVGISVAVKFPPAVILGISEHPTKEYKDWRTKLNGSLNIIVKSGAEILAGMGFNAIYLETGDEKIPHKTIATRAGVGWIGKCALLVTEEYGSAIRIASILTDAPLTISIPINSSKCKDSCNSCMSSCPGNAVLGNQWDVGTPQEYFYDRKACYEAAKKQSNCQSLGNHPLCGKCIEICPITRKYLRNG